MQLNPDVLMSFIVTLAALGNILIVYRSDDKRLHILSDFEQYYVLTRLKRLLHLGCIWGMAS